MSVSTIYLANLPHELTDLELRDFLVDELFMIFREPARNNTLHCITYRTGQSTKGVVTGFSYQYEKLCLLFRTVQIRNRIISVHPDTAEPRGPDGNRIATRSAAFKREMEGIFGEVPPHKKVTHVFPKAFLEIIGRDVFNLRTTTGYLNTTQLMEVEMAHTRGVVYFERLHQEDLTRVVFASLLEYLQAIVFHNNHPDLVPIGRSLPKFVTQNRSEYSLSNYRRGFGCDNSIVPIRDFSLEFGFLPFSRLNREFFDITALEQLGSHCLRCKSKYNIIGINYNLNSYAGTCRCSYSMTQIEYFQHLENLPQSITRPAFRWEAEAFTRLILCRPDELDLVIQHQPIQLIYSTVESYVTTYLALLEEEWYCVSNLLKIGNSTTGVLRVSTDVETIRGDNPDAVEKYKKALQLDVIISGKVWVPGNPSAIKEATLKWSTNRTLEECGGEYRYSRKVKLFKIQEIDGMVNNCVRVMVQIIQTRGEDAVPIGQQFVIEPLPDKTEYQGIRHDLNGWLRQNEIEYPPLIKILLNVKASREDGWKIEEPPLERHCGPLTKQKIVFILGQFNPEQRTAYDKAVKSAISFLHGPPGCGKTYTAAKLSVLFILQEVGNILAVCPSNYAADALADAIDNVLESCDYELPIQVIRMYGKSRENRMLTTPAWQPAVRTRTLHDEVRRHPDWLTGAENADFAQKVRDNQLYLLTSDELARYREHVDGLERSVMKKQQIVICTFGTLYDGRINNPKAFNHPFTTIITDESGQIKHCSLIQIFNLKPVRVIIVGDHNQLPPTVVSRAGSVAGLGKSLMEIASLQFDDYGNSVNEGPVFPIVPQGFLPAWTTLLTQHRMHSEIREIVSRLTYNNILQDAPSVLSRPLPNRMLPVKGFLCGRRVGILNSNFPEAKEGTSTVNEGEAISVSRLVGKMLRLGILPSDITVLTFYDGQKHILRLHIPAAVEIENVDAYQGRENQIVIVSFVRNNPQDSVGFLQHHSRINVAISRAKEFLVLSFCKPFIERQRTSVLKKLCALVKENNEDDKRKKVTVFST